jgi:hypothetical protein
MSADLNMDDACLPSGLDDKWHCAARVTIETNGEAGKFSYTITGTLHPACNGPASSFNTPFGEQTATKGKTTYVVTRDVVFDKPPNPSEVNGQPAVLSTARVELAKGGVQSPVVKFRSSYDGCGKE